MDSISGSIYNAADLEERLGSRKYDLLYDASVSNNIGDVIALLNASVNPDTPACRREGETPLHGAAKKGNLGASILLLEKKADPLAQDKKGRSPLWHAAKTSESLALIMLNCSDKNPEKSPLPRAIKYGHFALADKLLDRECRTGAKDYVSLSRALEQKRRDIAKKLLKQEDGEEILWGAVASSDLETVKFCLKRGVDPNRQNSANEESILHFAAEQGSKKIVKALLKNYADINAVYRERKPEKIARWWTPLGVAAREGNDKVVAYLLDKNAIIELGEPPLLHALKNHHFSTAAALLDAGADMNETLNNGMPFYDYFSHREIRDTKVVQFLDEYNRVNFNDRDDYESSEDVDSEASSMSTRDWVSDVTEEVEITGLPSLSEESARPYSPLFFGDDDYLEGPGDDSSSDML